MFAYLISKLLCNIYQSLDIRSEKSASLERTKTSFGLRETLRETFLESFLKLLVRKNYLLCVYRDLNCIHNNGLNRKISLWKALSKRQTVRIILPLTLRNALRKSRRKLFAYLITVKIKPQCYYVI